MRSGATGRRLRQTDTRGLVTNWGNRQKVLAYPSIRGDLNRARFRVAMLRGRKTARADRRLRTDEKAIRTQSAILYKTPGRPCFNRNRVFCTDAFCPCGKHGWRAQRASLLVACDGIKDAVFNTAADRRSAPPCLFARSRRESGAPLRPLEEERFSVRVYESCPS